MPFSNAQKDVGQCGKSNAFVIADEQQLFRFGEAGQPIIAIGISRQAGLQQFPPVTRRQRKNQ